MKEKMLQVLRYLKDHPDNSIPGIFHQLNIPTEDADIIEGRLRKKGLIRQTGKSFDSIFYKITDLGHSML